MGNVATLFFDIDSEKAKDASKNMDAMKDSAGSAEKGAKKLGESSAAASTSMAKFGATIVRTISAIAGITAAMALARKSITAGLKFDEALGEASTLIEGTVEQMEFLSTSARDMAKQFGTTGVEQVQAFYQAISAGSETVEEAADLLDIANRLAIGGVTDLVTSIDVLTTATNAYSTSGLTAAQASDILFAGVVAGKTTIGELGSAIGRVASIANTAGLSFADLTAGVATLTASGITTSEAVTGMRAIINGLIRPTDEASKAATRMSLDFNVTALETKGLTGFIESLIIATGGSIEKMGELFSGQEALAPILALTGGLFERLVKNTDDIANSAGKATTAFEKMAEKLSKRLDVQMSIIGNRILGLGTVLLTVLVPSLEFATKNAELLGAALAILAATQIPRLIVALGALIRAAQGAGFAMIILGGVPGVIAASVAALVIGLGFLIGVFDKTVDASKNLRKITDGLVDSLKEEKIQAEALAGILDSGQSISAEVAKQKLVEARARLANVDAIIAEQQAVALGSAVFREANAEFEKQQRLVDSAQGMFDVGRLAQSSLDFQKARRNVALDARNALLADARLTNQNAEILENIVALEKIIDAGGRASVTTPFDPTSEGEEKTPFQELIAGLEERIKLLDQEQQLVGKSTLQQALLNAEFDNQVILLELSNIAKDKNSKITMKQIAEAKELAGLLKDDAVAMAILNDVIEKNVERQREAAEEAASKEQELKELTGDIIDPLKNSLKEGEANFASFADTLVSIAARLRDRLLDELFDPIEDALFDLLNSASQGQGSSSGGIGGLLLSLGGALLGGLAGGGGGSGTAGAFAALLAGGSGRVGGGREHGGPVQAGKTFIVGERGPELFVPEISGTILPRVPSGAIETIENSLVETKLQVDPMSVVEFAHGGISSVPAIFGEAGPEAVVPLPDGRRIPVDLRIPSGAIETIQNSLVAPKLQADPIAFPVEDMVKAMRAFAPPDPISVVEFAHGGISSVPAIFGEAGPEAAVPLPDGRRIPVDLRIQKPAPQSEQQSAPVNTFYIDASGADPAAIERLEAVLRETVGPGKIESRAVAAVVGARRRNPRLFGGA